MDKLILQFLHAYTKLVFAVIYLFLIKTVGKRWKMIVNSVRYEGGCMMPMVWNYGAGCGNKFI